MRRDIPDVPCLSLDTVWFQVAGTLCNLACRHCFISCGPTNRSHGMMSREEVARYLIEAESLGVNDTYFTGGEPFLNAEMLGILQDALAIGPATVLTNGTLIHAARGSAGGGAGGVALFPSKCVSASTDRRPSGTIRSAETAPSTPR